MVAMKVCPFWCCGCCVPFLGLFVDFRRTFGDQSIVERERGSLRRRVVLLWMCSVPSLPVCLPVWLPVHGIHYMSTSGYSSNTPEIELIKWAWLDIFHTTDVFDVVFGSIPRFLAHRGLIKVVP